MSIELQYQNWYNIFGPKSEPKKFVISNYNEIATIPLTAEEGLAETSERYDYAPAKVSERLYYNYQEFTLDSLKRKFPDIELKFIGSIENPVAIKRISDTLDHLPPRVRDSIKGFVIYSDEKYQEASPGESSAWTFSDRIIRLRLSDLTESTIYHEAAHDLTYQLQQEADKEKSRLKIQEYNKLKSEIKQLAKKYNIEVYNIEVSDSGHGWSTKIGTDTKLFSDEVDPLIKKRKEEIAVLTASPFASEWSSISGDVYGKGLAYKETGGRLAYIWNDGSDRPKNGCVRAYSCNNFMEDVATFVENVYKKPDFYQPLIDPKSPIYDKRYVDKINLLLKYDFIDETSYKRITAITGQNKGDYYEVKRNDGKVYRYFYANGMTSVGPK